MNFAVIGLGSFGVKRAKAINDFLKNANLKCLFDLNDQNAKKASKDLGVPVKSYEEILKDETINTVCICTPNKFHKKIILDSLNEGRMFFVKNPTLEMSKKRKKFLKLLKSQKVYYNLLQTIGFLKVLCMQEN